jgi:hypothetical protein
VRVAFSRWHGNPEHPRATLKADFDLYYLVRPVFADPSGKPIAPRRLASLTLRSDIGLVRTFSGAQLGRPHWLQGARVVSSSGAVREIEYAVDRAIVGGANVVSRGQQRFYPARTRLFRVKLLLYAVRFAAHDLLFRSPVGSGIALTYPDGHTERHAFADDGTLTLRALPRGQYHAKVIGAHGMASLVPIALSRNQTVPLKVVSLLDLGVVFLVLGTIAVALLLVRRPQLRALFRPRVLRLPAKERS